MGRGLRPPSIASVSSELALVSMSLLMLSITAAEQFREQGRELIISLLFKP